MPAIPRETRDSLQLTWGGASFKHMSSSILWDKPILILSVSLAQSLPEHGAICKWDAYLSHTGHMLLGGVRALFNSWTTTTPFLSFPFEIRVWWNMNKKILMVNLSGLLITLKKKQDSSLANLGVLLSKYYLRIHLWNIELGVTVLTGCLWQG